MMVSNPCPPLASRLTAVPSSELASGLSAELAHGPLWTWAWTLPRTMLTSMLTSMRAVAQTLVSTRRTGQGMAGRPR